MNRHRTDRSDAGVRRDSILNPEAAAMIGYGADTTTATNGRDRQGAN